MPNLTGLVVIDGANATGKSTLAGELRRRHDGVILHQTYRFKANIFNYHTAVLRLAIRLAERRLVILDRLWMSEAVYAEVYRGGTPWPHQGRMVDRVLQKACAVQVVCVDHDPHALMARYRESRAHRSDVDLAQNLKANELYLQIFDDNAGWPTINNYMAELARDRADIIQYPVGHDDLTSACEEIEEALISFQATQFKGALSNDNLLGRLSNETRFLIVGDVPNAKHRWTWPFYEYANSSLWLAQQLSKIRFDESQAVWTNANDPKHDTLSQLVKEELDLLHRVNVVALGANAQQTLKQKGVASTLVPHPQYGRRFMAKSEEKYQELLKSALPCLG